MSDTLEIKFPAESLEYLAEALAEGEHNYGIEYTLAGYSLIMWPNLETWGSPQG